MRAVFCIICLFTSLLAVAAPDGTVRGRVFDVTTGIGLEEVDILYGKNQGTLTGKDGAFYIDASPGRITLTFRYVGYKTVKRDIYLTENDTIFLNIGLEQEVTNIEQVVVSAGRVEQRISELSVSMNVIKPGFLSENHISDTRELITKTSGIEVMDGQASVRGGSGFSYGAGSRVLALIDGLPVISADAGNIRWQFLPMENISQIEIIKGASSVIYGSSALNGVINFRTADAQETPSTRFFVETGIFGTSSNKEWKWWTTPRTFMSSSFSHLRKLGNTDLAIGAYLLNDNGYRKLNSDRLMRLNLKLKHRNRQVNGLTYGLSFNGGANEKTDFILWENATDGALKQQEATAIELRGNFFALDPFVSLKKGDRNEHDFRGRFQFSDNKYPHSEQNDSETFSFFSEYRFFFRFSNKLSLNSGLSQNLSRVHSRFYGNHNGWNAGIFSQLDYAASRRLRITSGIRMEQNRLDGDYDKLIPLFRAGLNFRVLDYTFIRASYGQGYRFPSIAEKYAATALGSVKIFPNPFIKPEEGWNTEVGIKQGIIIENFNGFFDAALFYLQNINMIEYIFGIYPDPGAETFSFGFRAENQEASRVYGSEIQFALTGVTGKFTHNFSGGYTFMYPVEFNQVTGKNSDVMLKYRRKHSAVLNFSTACGKTELGIGIYAKSKLLNIDDVFLNELTRENLLPGFYDYWIHKNKGYWLTDVSLKYSINSRYDISFVVKNATNTEYMGRPGDIQPHRNFSLRFSGNF